MEANNMAETKIVESTPAAAQEAQVKYHITPTHYLEFDDDGKEWTLEIHLPGVAKENIKFKALPDAYFLEARREVALYSVSEYFPFDVDVSSISGKYSDGLLIVKGKIKDPLAEAVNIKLD